MSELPVNILGYSWLGPERLSRDGVSSSRQTEFNVRPLLRDKKAIKFMAKQDQMAVYAAIRAVEKAGLNPESFGENTGLYFAVGSIPFEQQPLDVLYEKSIDAGAFSMQRFSTDASTALNPLLTFKCLPNMPVFHVSYNLYIQGPYYVTYPGAGQWFQALQQAMLDLAQDRVEYAVVGAVADQLNPLVKHHVQRNDPQSVEQLIDAACVLVLAKHSSAASLGQMADLRMSYVPQDILCEQPDMNRIKRALEIDAGPVDPAMWIALRLDGRLDDGQPGEDQLHISTLDGITASLGLSIP